MVQRTLRRSRKKRNYSDLGNYLMLILLVLLLGLIRLPAPDYSSVEPGRIDDAEGLYETDAKGNGEEDIAYEELPEYSGSPYCRINGGKPGFSADDIEVLSSAGYEYYSSLDVLGRCGYCEACVGQETMPEEGREDIWMVHPSGWRSGQGWERCHIIGFQLTGENANDHNLITGTHFFNVDGMLPFENEVAGAARKGKHVMYRVEPVYKGNELICRGVHMMAQSMEDDSVSFNVFVYNVEPGKTIDYVSGYIK